MEVWVHNIIGLTLAFDMVAAACIVGFCAWATWRYDYAPVEHIHVYKSYNYNYKGDLKDEALEGVAEKPTNTADVA
jgi:hypothetical protein